MTQYFIDSQTQFTGDVAPIGYPSEEMEVLLLDEAGNPVNDGEVGEMVIKSRYLSPGYWHRPDLTQENFQTDPEDGEMRSYYSGDLGRRNADGCLYHMGRKDDRVKVRGYTVEVAEIEAALMGLNQFRRVFVTQRDRRLGEKTLVAYLVPARWPALNASQLRRALAAVLPAHMIPASFVMLESMPLTPNRKVDRQALPEPSSQRPNTGNAFVAPRTPVEQQLASIWATVLGLDRVGIDDNFFDLGGHSLAAMQVITRALQQYPLELPIKALFDAPTVAGMAQIIDAHRDRQATGQALDRLLREIEAMTEEEARKQLTEEKKGAENI